EYSELKIKRDGRSIKPDEYVSVIGNKTASLFQSSAKIGSMIAGAKQQTTEAMSDFGLNLGIAYQMQDDLLDWNQKASLEQALGAEQAVLQNMSYDFALNAKNALSHLQGSDAKERLEELADFAVRRRF
ncbi:MAG: polyprenyl synthetase family protein, partial [Nitrososphaerales archaeon]